MTASAQASPLDDLAARHPEWHAWLALYREARGACDDEAWTDAVPEPVGIGSAALITGTTFAVDGARAKHVVRALVQRAFTVDRRAIDTDVAVRTLHAAVNEDRAALETLAGRLRVGAELFGEVAALAAMPLLQACRAAWAARVPADWMAAACPVCGAWAALAEARGLERSLRLRCARCGADWMALPVRCAFCGTADHEKLGALVAERSGDTRRVETCGVCLAFMKTVMTLQPCPAGDVRLLDLATVELDVAAMEHGFARPARPARALDVRVIARPRGRLSGLFRR